MTLRSRCPDGYATTLQRMGDADLPGNVRNVARGVYARLADGDILSHDEVLLLGEQVVAELRAQALRNQRRLVEAAGTLRLELPRRP
jgi:hypothetical protein